MKPCGWGNRLLCTAVLALGSSLGSSLVVGQEPAEAHGALDAFAGAGVSMAWGILRGRDETSTIVVVRVEPDRAVFGSVAVTGIDPFTRRSESLLPRTAVDGGLEFRLPRARFADLPRTEWRFFPQGAGASDAATLLVYFQGIPDTTPEFDDEARMRGDIARRLARARETKVKR